MTNRFLIGLCIVHIVLGAQLVEAQPEAIELTVIDKFPDQGLEEEYYLSRPLDIVHLGNGRVAVSDQLAARIFIFDENGSLERTIGRDGTGPGEFQQLTTLSYDESTGKLWAKDLRTIQAFDPMTGAFIGSFIRKFQSQDMAVNGGYVYLTRYSPAYPSVIEVLSTDGDSISTLGPHTMREVTPYGASLSLSGIIDAVTLGRKSWTVWFMYAYWNELLLFENNGRVSFQLAMPELERHDQENVRGAKRWSYTDPLTFHHQDIRSYGNKAYLLVAVPHVGRKILEIRKDGTIFRTWVFYNSGEDMTLFGNSFELDFMEGQPVFWLLSFSEAQVWKFEERKD